MNIVDMITQATRLREATLQAMKSRGFGEKLQLPEVPATWKTDNILPVGIAWHFPVSNGFANPEIITAIYSVSLESDDKLWLHLSISKKIGRKIVLPSYNECQKVRAIVYGNKWSVQYFPPQEQYVNIAEVLHFWHCLEGNPFPDFRKLGGAI